MCDDPVCDDPVCDDPCPVCDDPVCDDPVCDDPCPVCDDPCPVCDDPCPAHRSPRMPGGGVPLPQRAVCGPGPRLLRREGGPGQGLPRQLAPHQLQ